MKLILITLFTFFTSTAFACTDFSGSYKEIGNSVITFEQAGCNSMTMSSANSSETIIADGKYRLSEENDQVRITSAGEFIGDNFTVSSMLAYKIPFPPEVQEKNIPALMVNVYTLDSAGNLINKLTFYNSKNQVITQLTTTHKRI